jgi:hypothetical protein
VQQVTPGPAYNETPPLHSCRVLCSQESMRVLPVSADGTAVQVPQDIQLGGHTVPAK